MPRRNSFSERSRELQMTSFKENAYRMEKMENGDDSGYGTSSSGSDDGQDSSGVSQEGVCARGVGHYLKTSLTELMLGSCVNVLMPAAILAVCAKVFKWGDVWIFVFSLIALVPFAERVSFVTEDVAKYTNDTIGGLLNASFGNVTEVIVCIFALQAGLLRVVQLSMLGSILSNLLFVLGSAFLVGGLKHPYQQFNQAAVLTNVGLLMVACLALSMPSILDSTHEGSVILSNSTEFGGTKQGSWLMASGKLEEERLLGGDAPVWLSLFISIVMLVVYMMQLIFQLCTHTDIFEGEQEENEDPGVLGFWGGIFWLAVITAIISFLSDFLVDTVERASMSLKVPILFLSGILIPIVGNAAEHAAAITFAYRNKMEISLGSSIGSAVQIALFVIPLTVVMGHFMGRQMTLNFHLFETACLLLACVLTTFVVMEGRSFWVTGVMLIAAYVIIAASFWAHADPMTMD